MHRKTGMPAVTPDIPKTEIAIVEMTNAFRQENRLAAVQLNPTLTQAARTYAQFLATTELFSHEADGRRPADRARAAGYQFCEIAENLASFVDSRGFETRDLARQMVEGWKNSPSHRKALLAPGVTELGVAVVKVKGAEKYLSVQLFGRPESLQFSFAQCRKFIRCCPSLTHVQLPGTSRFSAGSTVESTEFSTALQANSPLLHPLNSGLRLRFAALSSMAAALPL